MLDFLEKIESDFLSQNIQDISSQIKWKDNEISRYDSTQITEYYKNRLYGKKTRWELWNKVIRICKKHNIKNLIDIGTANGHFPFLCLSNNIKAYGIDPSKYEWVDNLFKKNFGGKFIFQGTINSLAINFKMPNDNMTIDCVSILNFFHGAGHNKEEIIDLFNFVDKHVKYFICTQPKWDELGLRNMLKDYQIIEKIDTYFYFSEVIKDVFKPRNIKNLKYYYQKHEPHYVYKIR